MASTPAFPSTLHVGFKKFSGADTSRTAPTPNVIVTGVAAGTIVNRVVVKSEDDFADGIVILWVTDDGGTTWFMFDEIDTGDGPNGDNTTPAYRYEKQYSDLFLPSTSHKLGATITVAPTTGSCVVLAFGGDLT